MKAGRLEGKSPKIVELTRAQQMKADGIKKEWNMLKQSVRSVTSASSEIVLGIMAVSGANGIEILKKWVTSLNISRGILNAVDTDNQPIDIASLQTLPVYIKYNSSENGNAYMKPFDGQYSGVIFQPKISNRSDFFQFGNIPSAIFN